ncbi:MAG: cupin domain-containing protein [Planctomycetota bacterium]|nr:cupin domain-containing protein [Planctomycetota bacterium]
MLEGELKLEIQGEKAQILRPGDSFYVASGRPVRGCCATGRQVRLITVQRLPDAKK